MTRDKAYQRVLKSLETLEAVFRQQPGNRAALEKRRQDLSDGLAALEKTALPVGSGDEKASDSGAAEAGHSVAPPPAGPVTGSGAPPTDQNLERQRKATETDSHLPGPTGTDREVAPKSLRGIPERWVRAQCEAAGVSLAEIGRLLAQPRLGENAVRDALARVRGAVERMSSPPAESEPATPKGRRP
jgi:hypothetical protein